MATTHKVPSNISKCFPGGTVVKNPPANAGDARDPGSIPGSRGHLEWETATHSSSLAGKTPWTEEPGGPQSTGLQRDWQDWEAEHTPSLDCCLVSSFQLCRKPAITLLTLMTFLLLTHLRWCRKETMASVKEHIICFSNFIVYGLGFSEH